MALLLKLSMFNPMLVKPAISKNTFWFCLHIIFKWNTLLAFTIPFTMKAKDIKNVHLFLCKSALVDF